MPGAGREGARGWLVFKDHQLKTNATHRRDADSGAWFFVFIHSLLPANLIHHRAILGLVNSKESLAIVPFAGDCRERITWVGAGSEMYWNMLKCAFIFMHVLFTSICLVLVSDWTVRQTTIQLPSKQILGTQWILLITAIQLFGSKQHCKRYTL